MQKKFRGKNLSYNQFAKLLMMQRYKCIICKCAILEKAIDRKNMAVIDHCHNCDAVRGLLCSQCNLDLGAFEHGRSRGDTFIKTHGNSTIENYLLGMCNCFEKHM